MKPILLLSAALACASACTDPCLELAQKICDCQPTSALRDSCRQSASTEKGRINITSQDDQACSALVDGCDCHLLDTPEGKVKCGQARLSNP